MGKVRERLKKLEETKKTAESKETEKRKDFMENWKEKERRNCSRRIEGINEKCGTLGRTS